MSLLSQVEAFFGSDALPLREALTRGAALLSTVSGEQSMLDAKLLLLEAVGQRGHSINLLPNIPINQLQREIYLALLARRLNHEPVAYIVGSKEFWSLDFEVSPAVLIPRPDSETIVQAALDYCPEVDHPYAALDLGVGSGCLLLSFLRERPKAHGIGVDASIDAIAVATRNADRLGVRVRTTLQISDWFEGLDGTFDLIISNPPYIAKREIGGLMADVRDFEPIQALSPGPSGLEAYRRIIPSLGGRLRPGGHVVFEFGAGQGSAVAELLVGQGFRIVEIRPDLAGISRAIVARLDHK